MNNNSPLNTQNTISNDHTETKTQTPIKKIIKKIKKYYSIVKAKLSFQINRVSQFKQEQRSDLIQVQQQVDNRQPIQNQNASILAQNQLPQKIKLSFSFYKQKRKQYVQLKTEIMLMDDKIKKIMKAHQSFYKNGVILIPLSFYLSCIQQLKNDYPDYDFEEEEKLTQYLINLENIPLSKEETIRCYSINKNKFNQLRPYQQQCVTKGVEFNGRILIAMQAGFGKTFSSLALADVYRHAWPLLIICPSSLKEHWSNEIKKLWLNKEPQIQIIENSKERISRKPIIIISHKLCNKLKEKILAKKFQIFIYDEAQYLRNQIKNTEGCQAIFKQAQYRIFLSDLFLTDQFTNFMNEQQLLGCYEPAKDVYNSLPQLIRHFVQIPNICKQLDHELSKLLRKQQILNFVKPLLKGNEKIVFYAFQQDILYAVRNRCDKMNVKSILIDGQRTKEQRKFDLDNFQQDSSIKIAILSYSCFSLGISLNAASTIIFGELYYEPEFIMFQAESRVYRLGQLKNVNCYYLIGNTEAEWKMFQKFKLKYVGQISRHHKYDYFSGNNQIKISNELGGIHYYQPISVQQQQQQQNQRNQIIQQITFQQQKQEMKSDQQLN